MADWIRGASASDQGAVREYNEDACLYKEDGDAAIAVVADGLGGFSAGRVAADIAVEECRFAFDGRIVAYAEAWWRAEHAEHDAVAWSALSIEERVGIEVHVREVLAKRVATTLGDLAIVEREGEILARIAQQALEHANREVLARSTSDTSCRGMGTTGVVAVFGHGVVGLGHVGDSRIYRIRSGALEQLTSDHTLLNEYIKMKHLTTPEEIEAFPHKNVIVRALGMKESVLVDIQIVETRPGDMFLLASDGLHTTWTDALILRAIEAHGVDAAVKLVEDGRRSRNNKDNITAVLVESRSVQSSNR